MKCFKVQQTAFEALPSNQDLKLFTFLASHILQIPRPIAGGWGKSAIRSSHKQGQKCCFFFFRSVGGSKSPLVGSKRSTFTHTPSKLIVAMGLQISKPLILMSNQLEEKVCLVTHRKQKSYIVSTQGVNFSAVVGNIDMGISTSTCMSNNSSFKVHSPKNLGLTQIRFAVIRTLMI